MVFAAGELYRDLVEKYEWESHGTSYIGEIRVRMGIDGFRRASLLNNLREGSAPTPFVAPHV